MNGLPNENFDGKKFQQYKEQSYNTWFSLHSTLYTLHSPL